MYACIHNVSMRNIFSFARGHCRMVADEKKKHINIIHSFIQRAKVNERNTSLFRHINITCGDG